MNDNGSAISTGTLGMIGDDVAAAARNGFT